MFNNQQLYERRMHVKMDRLADPLADLAKNRLPDGLKGIGMGLGVNGQPLVDVSSTKVLILDTKVIRFSLVENGIFII